VHQGHECRAFGERGGEDRGLAVGGDSNATVGKVAPLDAAKSAGGKSVAIRRWSASVPGATRVEMLPNVIFDGAVDTVVDDHVGAELLATLREALSNVARHARATTTEISVAAGDESSSVSATTAVACPPTGLVAGWGCATRPAGRRSWAGDSRPAPKKAEES
jgi:hypothetical protein